MAQKRFPVSLNINMIGNWWVFIFSIFIILFMQNNTEMQTCRNAGIHIHSSKGQDFQSQVFGVYGCHEHSIKRV